MAEPPSRNLCTVRSYMLKEDLQLLWDCRPTTQANRFVKRWCRRRMLRKHRSLVLNWFRTGRAFSSGAVEGTNNKAKLAFRKAYGFRSNQSYELELYRTLADLPRHSLAPQVVRNRSSDP